MSQKILFCQIGGIGDIIQTTNILRIFKREDPNCEITYGTTTYYREILDSFTLIDNVITVLANNKYESFHYGKDLMEKYIEQNRSQYDRVYFPQACYHREILNKNGMLVVKTMFELCGINDMIVKPFAVIPSSEDIEMAEEWWQHNVPSDKTYVFIECKAESGQSFIHTPEIMLAIIRKVRAVLNDRFCFIVSGRSDEFGVIDEGLILCTLKLLPLLAVLRKIDAFIGVHSGLTNLYGSEYCFNPRTPVMAVIHQNQAPLTIGPMGYPLIKKMIYVFDYDHDVIAKKIVGAIKDLP